MQPIPVIAIFDVGKINKKLMFFNEQYKLVYEENMKLPETKDEDGFPCEDIQALTNWVWETFWRISSLTDFEVRAMNFSAYGASFVHLDDYYEPVTPLYNYLKPYPEALQKQFYETYGGECKIALETASPVLGSLNSGLQLYRIKYEKPDLFNRIKYSLHLPQYISYIVSSRVGTDITSVGSHTSLWDFQKNNYHDWVEQEGMDTKFAPMFHGNELISESNDTRRMPIGVGLHDSSAALIPYLQSFTDPFALISTGTWCITLNPFNQSPLTYEELQQDCLCYLSFQGKPVKASRLFAGYEHEEQVKRLSTHFNKPADYYSYIKCDDELVANLKKSRKTADDDLSSDVMVKASSFPKRDLFDFSSYEEAYHQLIFDLINQQVKSTQLVLRGTEVKKIFVDGGFGKNPIYMQLLAAAFPDMEVYAANVAQATAIGAAVAIHPYWNSNPLPEDLIELTYYPSRDSSVYDNQLVSS
jgi:sugar (pentulose or hexulose) kinase